MGIRVRAGVWGDARGGDCGEVRGWVSPIRGGGDWGFGGGDARVMRGAR